MVLGFMTVDNFYKQSLRYGCWSQYLMLPLHRCGLAGGQHDCWNSKDLSGWSSLALTWEEIIGWPRLPFINGSPGQRQKKNIVFCILTDFFSSIYIDVKKKDNNSQKQKNRETLCSKDKICIVHALWKYFLEDFYSN